MLMIAHVVIGLSLREKYGENLQKLLLACSIIITIVAAISIIFLAPRMLDVQYLLNMVGKAAVLSLSTVYYLPLQLRQRGN